VRLLEALRSKGETVEELCRLCNRYCGAAPASRSASDGGGCRKALCGYVRHGWRRGTHLQYLHGGVLRGGRRGLCVLAKHGNSFVHNIVWLGRTWLEALGSGALTGRPKTRARRLTRSESVFIFAPAAHTAARHAAAARQARWSGDGIQSAWPAHEPRQARRAQVLGVFAAKWTEPMALALAELGT